MLCSMIQVCARMSIYPRVETLSLGMNPSSRIQVLGVDNCACFGAQIWSCSGHFADPHVCLAFRCIMKVCGSFMNAEKIKLIRNRDLSVAASMLHRRPVILSFGGCQSHTRDEEGMGRAPTSNPPDSCSKVELLVCQELMQKMHQV
jgi:hypothetical protein